MRIILPVSEQVTPQVTAHVTPHVTPQVAELLKGMDGVKSRKEIQNALELKDREYFRKKYLNPAIEQNLVGLTIPDKPRSSKQKYYLTKKGEGVLQKLIDNKEGLKD